MWKCSLQPEQSLDLVLCVCLLQCPRALQEQRAGVEEYADKLAAASRRAELMVKEFEEMGAGV